MEVSVVVLQVDSFHDEQTTANTSTTHVHSINKFNKCQKKRFIPTGDWSKGVVGGESNAGENK